MERKNQKTSIFFKIFLGVLSINLLSNIFFAYIIYSGYEGIISQIRPFLSPDSFKNIEVNIYNTWLVAASSLLFVVLMAVLFTILFANKVLKPLNKLLDAVSEAKKGNLDIRVKVISSDEIGELSEEFNSMIAQLKDTKEALEDERAILEIKVKARTKELEELAQGLDEKIKERTRELQGRIEQLERFHRLTVGREMKMLELKKELDALKKSSKKKK